MAERNIIATESLLQIKSILEAKEVDDPEEILNWFSINGSELIGELLELRAERTAACRIIERLMIYAVLHEQDHPEQNGNRFDDMWLAREFLKRTRDAS